MTHLIRRESEERSNTTGSMEAFVELEEVANDNMEIAKRTLVGKILSKKILNKGAVRSICAAAWGEAVEVTISDMGPNLFMFTFPTEKVIQDIMSKSPWAVMNNILSLQTWNPEIAVSEIDFTRAPIWVQFMV